MNKLEQLANMTVIVADTGNLDDIQKLKPQDATTNPSLLLKAAKDERNSSIIENAIAVSDGSVEDACDRFGVLVGCEILKLIEGRVSTEVDAHLSFDTELMLTKARRLIELYEDQGVSKKRVLIKIAATWEGIQAAKVLETEGINCNLTLLFSFVQALACAQAKVFLISPFVGRILDWHRAANEGPFKAAEDPGVRSVSQIHAYYKTHGYETIVMGASFRNIEQIEALAGCDYLTVSPQLLQELSKETDYLPNQLANHVNTKTEKYGELSEQEFRWQLNENAMATEKLAEGIRVFALDQKRLESLLNKYIEAQHS